MHRSPILIPAGNPGPLTGAGTNTWLLDGDEPAIIDAGVGVPEHLDAIESALAGRPLARAIVTHGHADHASGAPSLLARWPRLELWKWPATRDTPIGWRPLTNGQTIAAGDVSLTVIHTPGHAPDHVCLWDPTARTLFAGDMLVQGSTVMIPSGADGDLGDYLASLDRMSALAPATVFPGHGPIITAPIPLIEAYIHHRLERERQVLACLDAGVTDPDSIVDRIYPDIAPDLRFAARMTVQAHLKKLFEG